MHFFEGDAIVLGEAASAPRCHYRRGALPAAPKWPRSRTRRMLRGATHSHYTGAATRIRGQRRTVTVRAVSEHAGPSLKAFVLAARVGPLRLMPRNARAKNFPSNTKNAFFNFFSLQ